VIVSHLEEKLGYWVWGKGGIVSY